MAAPTATPRCRRLGRHFIAGVLAHSAALRALAAPTVNSLQAAACRRIAVGHQLGAGLRGARARTTARRCVRTLPGRFEWRLPDASANPYLATAALIAAGLDGIDRKLEPPAGLQRRPVRAAAGADPRARHRAAAAVAGRGAGCAGRRRADLQRARRDADAAVPAPEARRDRRATRAMSATGNCSATRRRSELCECSRTGRCPRT